MDRSLRTTRTFVVAGAMLLAACSGSGATTTTEPLTAIATSAAPESTTTGAAETSAAPLLNDAQQATLDLLLAAFEEADSVAVLDLWTPAGEHYRPDIEFDIAMGGTWSDISCAVSVAGVPRCEMLYTNDLLSALDAPPLDAFFRLELSEDGAIRHWVYDTGNRATTAAYLQPFSDWVRDTDPEAAEDMFDFNGFGRHTPEAYQVWLVKVDEYLATLR